MISICQSIFIDLRTTKMTLEMILRHHWLKMTRLLAAEMLWIVNQIAPDLVILSSQMAVLCSLPQLTQRTPSLEKIWTHRASIYNITTMLWTWNPEIKRQNRWMGSQLIPWSGKFYEFRLKMLDKRKKILSCVIKSNDITIFIESLLLPLPLLFQMDRICRKTEHFQETLLTLICW